MEKRTFPGGVESKEEQRRNKKRTKHEQSWSDREGEIGGEKRKGEGEGEVEEFLRIRHASRPQNQE